MWIKLKNLLCISALALLILISLSSCSNNIKTSEELKEGTEQNINSSCIVEEEELIVNGNSMEPVLKNGDKITMLLDYYRCRSVERDDVIIYTYAGNSNPLIKIVKGISGDKFKLKKVTASCWNILINGKILKNSENLPYCVSEQGYNMLSLYENDYKGIIPPDTYLIFGNLPEGSLDSTHFGLISKDDILGKVVR